LFDYIGAIVCQVSRHPAACIANPHPRPEAITAKQFIGVLAQFIGV